MEQRNAIVGLVNFVIVLTILASLAAVGLWLFDFRIAAVIVGTITGASWLLAIVLVTAQVTRKQTIQTMREGADIALQAQHINDTWDAKKAKVLGDVMREGARMGRLGNQGGESQLALPLPSQADNWLPQMVELPIGEDVEEWEE